MIVVTHKTMKAGNVTVFKTNKTITSPTNGNIWMK